MVGQRMRRGFLAPSRVLLLTTLGTALLSGCGASGEAPAGAPAGENHQEIVGGTNANIATHPWQVSLQDTAGNHWCGGSILSASWILTAQHCVNRGGFLTAPSTLRVAAGSSTLSGMSSGGQIRLIDEIIPYPGYVDTWHGKDIALVHLSSPLDLGDPEVEPISLATAADAAAGYTNAGVMGTVTGWGRLSSGGSWPDTLQTVNVPIVSNETADAAYPVTITADQLAAGDMVDGGEDACGGDSGGPLVVSKGSGKILAGVVSWGSGCGDRRYPGMYARVSTFESWITPIIRSPLSTFRNITGLSDFTGGWRDYTVSVPAGTPVLNVHMSGGTGNAELYVHFNALPTNVTYTCHPTDTGNAGTCSIPNPAAGTWYISVYGETSYSGVALRATTYIPAGRPYALRVAGGQYLTAMEGGGKTAAHAIHTDVTVVSPHEKFVIQSLGGNLYSIQTASGKYVSATNGGGVAGAGALRTDAVSIGPNEKFTIISRGGNQFSIQTPNLRYLTAVGGGGLAALDSIHTDATVFGPHEAFELPYWGNNTYTIKTASGHYVSAVGGGNVGSPDVVHTDATAIGPWERFTSVSLGGNTIALRTVRGYYASAVWGGGLATAGAIHTNSTTIGSWERFTFVELGNNFYALRTSGGRYLTAVGGGGVVGPDAIHTDATSIGPWERFSFVPL